MQYYFYGEDIVKVESKKQEVRMTYLKQEIAKRQEQFKKAESELAQLIQKEREMTEHMTKVAVMIQTIDTKMAEQLHFRN